MVKWCRPGRSEPEGLLSLCRKSRNASGGKLLRAERQKVNDRMLGMSYMTSVSRQTHIR